MVIFFHASEATTEKTFVCYYLPLEGINKTVLIVDQKPGSQTSIKWPPLIGGQLSKSRNYYR